MCKHCKLDRSGETDGFIFYKDRPIKVGRATLGVEDLWALLDRDVKTGRWTLTVGRSVGSDNSNVWDYKVVRTKIKYCPFCGEKLADLLPEN